MLKKGLLILDVILRSTSSSILVQNINLEHIYPQKPHTDWALHGWPTSRDEQMDLISNIGNYLLLNSYSTGSYKVTFGDGKEVTTTTKYSYSAIYVYSDISSKITVLKNN